MTAPLRPFLGYVLAAPVLVAAAELSTGYPAAARTPSPGMAGLLGLGEIMTAAALPGAGLVAVEVGPDGTVTFTLPPDRAGYCGDVPAAELIADGLAVPRRRVRVPPARPAGGRTRGTPHPAVPARTPVRVAVAVARRRLLEAASATHGTPVGCLRLAAGAVTDRAGRRLDIGALAGTAASTSTIAVPVDLTPR
ncbi:isoquinoline 1-oxidoreductase [Micromonospora sp. NPDC048887]|uniref:isoquinoline 1-oxidoreductase n=1 Tax=unclassified Micromonospora TaxID=2617518 RepID=UPI0033CE23D1